MSTLTDKKQFAFSFIRKNAREEKPRHSGITEIRGPYYSPMGKNYLLDLLTSMGDYIDSVKFAGGSFTLLHEKELKGFIDICHSHDVLVSTGGFIEYALLQGAETVDRYIRECRNFGFDILEISSGFIAIPQEDILHLIKRVQQEGLRPKPEIGIQFGAGGASAPEELEAEGVRDTGWIVQQVGRFLDAGAYMIMIESEGITENVREWRTDVPQKIAKTAGLDKVMFEAADPEVFGRYVKNYGPEVNLFVDNSQIVQLECLREGIWGTKSLWGRVVTYKG
jgi:phosphosulfolactate synthase (CoM biosynthesis protein A)